MRRWLWTAMAFVLGGIAGLLLGVGATAFFWWCYSEVVREDALNPLADLTLESEHLSDEQFMAQVRLLADKYLAENDAGLAIAVHKQGHSKLVGLGTTNKEGGNVPAEDTIFELASVGKTFTATLLADMVLKDEVALDMQVDALLPEHVAMPHHADQPITLEDLATHSSGLPSLTANFEPGDPGNPYADFTVEQLYEGLAMVELQHPIGSHFGYSNVGFGLLGHVLARRAGADYESLVVRRICEPLGMHDTRMTLDETMRSRLALPHDGGRPVPVWEDRTLAGAGSFLSTPGDMLRYMTAHWEQDHPLAEAMTMTIAKRRATDTAATAIGLSWFIDSENALDIVWHNGGSGGSRSYAAMLPQHRTAVIVLANSSGVLVEELGKKLLYLAHRHWTPDAVEDSRVSAAGDPRTLRTP